jgi:hypothetical protein
MSDPSSAPCGWVFPSHACLWVPSRAGPHELHPKVSELQDQLNCHTADAVKVVVLPVRAGASSVIDRLGLSLSRGSGKLLGVQVGDVAAG